MPEPINIFMKKEVLIAVIAGLILGLIITFGIYTANRSLEQANQKKKAESQSTTVPTPPTTPTNKTLEITSHQNFDLIDQSGQTISGIAWSEAVVALMTESDNQLVQANQDGIFTFQTKLIKGFNEITVIASDETNTNQTQNLILTYSTHEIELDDQNEESDETDE